MDRKYLRNLVNIVLFLVGVVLVCLLVPRFLIFFMPFVVGWIIAMIANPLVKFMEKRLKIVRKHSSMVIIIGTIALIVLGGMGFFVWDDVVRTRRWSRMSIYSRLVLLSTAALIAGGMLGTLALEWNNPGTLGQMTWGQKLLAALFQSVTLRTAGFSAVDQGALTESGKLLS